MFGKRKFLLAFLNNSELRLSSYEISAGAVLRSGHETLVFSSSAVKDSAILDAQAFQSEATAFIEKEKKFKNLPVLLVIPEEKIFIKGFELDLGDLEKKSKFREDFITAVPFPEEDLLVRERLVGRVLEFSAVHKKFLTDLQKPFLDLRTEILGLISVPHAIALNLNLADKSFLLAFYDNDFAMMLAENSCVIFSETHESKSREANEAMRAFDHFVQHLKVISIKTISIIIGEDDIEDALKTDLEYREYDVKEIKKVNILDMIAGYYNSHRNSQKDWNLLYVKKNAAAEFWNKSKKSFLVIFILLCLGGAGWWAYAEFPEFFGGSKLLPTEPVVEVPAPAAEEEPAPVPTPVIKADFPIQISNGTKLAGEAGRLKTVLLDKGFAVSGSGNYANQGQVLTTIFANPAVPDEVISELRLILEARYKEVMVNSSTTEKVIHIVIGQK